MELPQVKTSINQHGICHRHRQTCFQYQKSNSSALIYKHFHLTAQISHQMFQKQEMLHQKPSQPIGYKLSCRCRETDPFCKRISKYLSSRKAPQHETDLFTHVRGLLYKQVTDSGQKFLAFGYTQVMEIYYFG